MRPCCAVLRFVSIVKEAATKPDAPAVLQQLAEVLAMPIDRTTAEIHLRRDAASEIWKRLMCGPTAGFALPKSLRLLFLLAHRDCSLDKMQQEFGLSSSKPRSGRGRPSNPIHQRLTPGWLAKFFEGLQDVLYGFNHVLPVANPVPATKQQHHPRLAPSKNDEHRELRKSLDERSRSFAKVMRPFTF